MYGFPLNVAWNVVNAFTGFETYLLDFRCRFSQSLTPVAHDLRRIYIGNGKDTELTKRYTP